MLGASSSKEVDHVQPSARARPPGCRPGRAPFASRRALPLASRARSRVHALILEPRRSQRHVALVVGLCGRRGAGTALGLSDGATIALAVALAFASGYAFTMLPLLRHGMALPPALKLALAADTASVAIMELTDNLIMLAIPGAMDADLDTVLFWCSLALALVLARLAAFPINRWLIARDRGHRVRPRPRVASLDCTPDQRVCRAPGA